MSGNRGGMMVRGRGGGSGHAGPGGGGRGGGQSGGGVRAHGSRGNFGGGHNRRGGSFTGNYSHQGSFRNRQGGGRSGRHDGGSSASFNMKDGTVSSFGNVGKKDENRRTLTDFKIIGLEMPDLSWSWGILSSSLPVKVEDAKEEAITINVSQIAIKEEHADTSASTLKTEDTLVEEVSQGTEISYVVGSNGGSMDGSSAMEVKLPPDGSAARISDANLSTPPPSRMRIYFHTPVTADDSRPIPHSSSFTVGAAPADSRKGKRKKLEDDDGDLEEDARVPPPPPQMTIGDDRSSVAASVAPSVAETTSEADWLMAAIEGEEEAETENVLHPGDEDEEQADAHRLVIGQEIEGITIDGIARLGEAIPDGNFDVKMNDTSVLDHAAPSIDNESDSSTRQDSNTPVAMNGIHDDMPSAAVNVVGGSEGDHRVDLDPFGAIIVNGVVEHEPQQSDRAMLSGENAGSGSSAPAPSDSSDHAFVSLQPQDATTVPSASVDEHSADHIGSPDTQVTQDGSSVTKSLQAVSLEPTLLNIEDSQEPQDSQAECDAMGSTHFDEENTESETLHGAADSTQPEHLPEPPASPASNTLPTTSSASTQADSPTVPQKLEIPSGRTPSANRLSISYAGGNRRLVIDAEVVQSFKLFRQDGRVEVNININKDSEDGLKGILVEGLSEVTKSYHPLQAALEAVDSDMTIPPFSKASVPSSVTLLVYLDIARPLSEPKWAKTGDVQDWLKSMFGRMFWVAGDAAEGWEKKIQVVDPDPPPTIWTVLEGWSQNSPVGALNERQRFLKTHMTETDNVLEILLRLVRGERATPFSQSTPTITAPSVSGPLLSALAQGSAHGSQQTHVSLAVLAIFRMATDYAVKVSGDKGKTEVDDRIGEIIRCLPSHLIYKSLDGIFKEWRVDKKGR